MKESGLLQTALSPTLLVRRPHPRCLKPILVQPIKPSPEAEIPVLVRGADTYFSETITATSEKTAYSYTFTADAADTAAQIAFQVGGHDYTNVTLTNIKLVKIG